MKIDKPSNINNILLVNKSAQSSNADVESSCTNKNITDLPAGTANELYFKTILQKQYSSQDIVKLLLKNGYVQNNNVFAKDLSEEQRLKLIFTLYPEIGANYDKDKEFVDKLINNEVLYNEYLKLASRTESVCKDSLNQVDIIHLSDFANLASGKVGEFLQNDFDYTMFIFKLMKNNNLFDRFMNQVKEQPVILNSLLQILENKPSVEEISILNNYKSLSAFSINASLRGDTKDSPVLSKANTIDGYLNKCTINDSMKLIRSDHMGILYSLIDKDKHFLIDELLNALRSKNIDEINNVCSKIKDTKPELVNTGYISTSLDNDMDRDIRWNLTVMPGVKGAYVDLLNILSYDTAQENEILLQRNTKFKVTDFKYDSTTKQFVIDANVYPEKFNQ